MDFKFLCLVCLFVSSQAHYVKVWGRKHHSKTMHCLATCSNKIRCQTLWKALAQQCQCLKMTHYLQLFVACIHEEAEEWASYQNQYWQWVNSRCLDKNKWKMLLEYHCACLPFCLFVILWPRSSWVRNLVFEYGVCHGFSSCRNEPSHMNFMNFILWGNNFFFFL